MLKIHVFIYFAVNHEEVLKGRKTFVCLDLCICYWTDFILFTNNKSFILLEVNHSIFSYYVNIYFTNQANPLKSILIELERERETDTRNTEIESFNENDVYGTWKRVE